METDDNITTEETKESEKPKESGKPPTEVKTEKDLVWFKTMCTSATEAIQNGLRYTTTTTI